MVTMVWVVSRPYVEGPSSDLKYGIGDLLTGGDSSHHVRQSEG
jgi:hypothetical protein